MVIPERPDRILIPLGATLGLPLAGLLTAGKEIRPYLEFPPKPAVIDHAPFSLPIFVLILAVVLLTTLPLVRQGCRPVQGRNHPARDKEARRKLPGWGKAGLFLFLYAGPWPGPGWRGLPRSSPIPFSPCG